MTYFVLWAGALFPGEDTRRLEGGDWGGLEAGAFIDGRIITAKIAQPIEIALDEDDEDDAEMPPLWVVPALVVRTDFADALREIGVENIHYYPAILRDRKRGKVWDDYLVANVIGLMDVIDVDRSAISPVSPPAVAMLFDKMVVDGERCLDQDIFRPFDRQHLVMISGRVANHLNSKKFPFLHLVPPEEFA